MNNNLVVLVIVNWKNYKMTLECVESIRKNTDYNNYRIILVDNGYEVSDNSQENLFELCDDVLVFEKNMGYTIATNTGWEYAIKKYDPLYICPVDNDIIIEQKEWLSILVREMNFFPECGIGTGKHLFKDGRLQQPWYPIPEMPYQNDIGKYDFVKIVPYFSSPSPIIRVDAIRDVGYYDESFFYGPNDQDYCRRMNNKGWKCLYIGVSWKFHLGSTTGLIKDGSKDFLYGEQCYGMLLYSYRYKEERIKMILSQFVRVFVTRKDITKDHSWNNLYWHNNTKKRFLMFYNSLIRARKDHHTIIRNNYEYKVLK